MTTQLNLLGILSAKGAAPTALASSETAATLPAAGAVPVEGSFFSALMQMIFHQSVDPRTIAKAQHGDPTAAPKEQTEDEPPKDRVADSIRALTFLQNEKAQVSTTQMQAALEQCDAQLMLKLPGEPGALLSYLTVQTEENHAGAVKHVALDGEADAAALLLPSEGDSDAASKASLTNPGDAPSVVPMEMKRPEAGVVPIPVETVPSGEIPSTVVPMIPLPQSGTIPLPVAEPAERRSNEQPFRTAPAAVPPPHVGSAPVPQQPAAQPLPQGLPQTAPLPMEAQTRTADRRSDRPAHRSPNGHAGTSEQQNRTPHSVTVQVPRSAPAAVEPLAFVPSASTSTSAPAGTGNEPSVRTIAVPVIPSGLMDRTDEQEQPSRTPQQSVTDAPLRSMQPQRNQRTEKVNDKQRSEQTRSSFSAKLDDAASTLHEMISNEEVKVVHTSAGKEGASSAGQEPKQQPQQSMTQSSVTENLPQRPAQQKEFSAPVVDRGAVGAAAPSDAKTFAAPVNTVNSTPFDRTTVQSMLEQLSKGVSVAVNEQHSEMKIVMHPESLGEVTLRVQVEEGKVSTSMDVQQTQVKQTIEANIPQLREALSAKGLTMDRIEVTTAQNGLTGESARNRQGNERKKGRQEFELMPEDEASVKLYGYNTVEYTI
jgi:flagellar hook-length control protein FliK